MKSDNNATASPVSSSKTSFVVGEYCVSHEIGKGSFAVVHLAHKRTATTTFPSAAPVAIKSISKDKLKGRLADNLEQEIKILTDFTHGNIVGLYEIVKTETQIHLVMEYCAMGDLSVYIKKKGDIHATAAAAVVQGNNSQHHTQYSNPQPQQQLHLLSILPNQHGGLNDWVVTHFLRQLASAMEFLRSHSLIHRDLKPQNLLLSPPPHPSHNNNTSSSSFQPTHLLPTLKLADFGFARLLPSQSLASTLCGSPLYMAPEILRGDAYDAKADLWSIGAIVFEMCYGRPPFRAQNHIELLRKIERSHGASFPDEKAAATTTSQINGGSGGPKLGSTPTSSSSPPIHHLNHRNNNNNNNPPPPLLLVSSDLKDFISKLLRRNPVVRITFEEFFLHPAVRGFSSIASRLEEEERRKMMMTRKSSSQLQQQQSSSSSSPVDVSQYHDPAASLLSPPPPQSNPPSQNVIPSSSPSISASSVSIPNVHYTTTAKQSFLSHLKSQTSHQQHQLQLQTQTPVHVNETTSGGISSSIRPSNNSSIAVAGGGSGGGVVRDDLPFSSIQISATSAPIAPGTIAMMMGGGGRVSRHASRVTEAPFPGYGFDPNVFEEIMGGGGGNGTPTTQQPSPLKNIQQQQLQQQQENITTTHAQLIALRGHSVTPDTAISDMSLESLGLSEHRKGGRGGGGGSQSSSTGSNGSQRDEYVVVEKTAGLVEINWMGGDGGGGRQQQHPITAPDHHQHQHQNGIIQSTASSSGVTGDGYAFQYPPYLFCIPSMTTPSSTNHTQQRTLLLADESHIPFLRKDKLQDYMNSFEDMDTLNLCVLHGYAIHLLAHDFDQQAETKNHQQNQQDLSTHSSSSSVSASIIKYEAVNLFLAALALYQLGMDLAKSLWTKFSPPTASSSTDQYHCDHPPGVGTSLGVDLVQLRGLVHWTRHRFNECLDCASRWQQQQQKAGMTDHVLQNQHVRSAEKLIFLRAVEMSNIAALNEVNGMDLPGCEMAYEQSILLLEALLSLPNNEQVSVGDDTNPDNNGRDGRDGSGNEEMTDEDRGLIENLVANLYARAEHVRTSMK